MIKDTNKRIMITLPKQLLDALKKTTLFSSSTISEGIKIVLYAWLFETLK